MNMKQMSFVLYHDYAEFLDELTDKEVAGLFRAVFKFAISGEDCVKLSKAAKIAYVTIRNNLRRDKEKYDERCERNRANGKLGGRPKTQSEVGINQPDPSIKTALRDERPSAAATVSASANANNIAPENAVFEPMSEPMIEQDFAPENGDSAATFEEDFAPENGDLGALDEPMTEQDFVSENGDSAAMIEEDFAPGNGDFAIVSRQANAQKSRDRAPMGEQDFEADATRNNEANGENYVEKRDTGSTYSDFNTYFSTYFSTHAPDFGIKSVFDKESEKVGFERFGEIYPKKCRRGCHIW